VFEEALKTSKKEWEKIVLKQSNDKKLYPQYKRIPMGEKINHFSLFEKSFCSMKFSPKEGQLFTLLFQNYEKKLEYHRKKISSSIYK
jgi:hypothetical protein